MNKTQLLIALKTSCIAKESTMNWQWKSMKETFHFDQDIKDNKVGHVGCALRNPFNPLSIILTDQSWLRMNWH
jgi:hypothetical protein